MKIVLKKLIDTSKSMLLQCAKSDSIARLSASRQSVIDKDTISNEYFTKQKHTSLKDMIKYHLKSQQQQFNLNRHLLQIQNCLLLKSILPNWL